VCVWEEEREEREVRGERRREDIPVVCSFGILKNIIATHEGEVFNNG